MKTDAILKINKMGQVGNIVLIIAKVLCIIALVGTIVATAAIAAIPRDFITLGISGVGDVEVNMEAIGTQLTEEERMHIDQAMGENGGSMSLDVNGAEVYFDSIEANGNVIHISSSGATRQRMSLYNFLPGLICAIMTLALMLTSLFFAGALTKAFENCATPFEESVIKKMRNFAFSLIPWVVMTSISESVLNSVLSGAVNVNISIDFAMLAIVLIILALVYIFKYGAMLQQESDETL